MKRYTVAQDALPERLDRAVAGAFGLGLRSSRAHIAAGRVRVDGRILSKGTMVVAGQEMTLLPQEPPARVDCSASIVARTGVYAALSKPGGVHSVAGRAADTVEAMLPPLGLAGWLLLNRLDCLTSGLVLAGRDEGALGQYKQWQEQGLVRKWYLAVACGQVEPAVIRNRILDEKRKIVRVLDEPDEPVRRTEVHPLAPVPEGTLVLVRIFMGRRHQIRAHLAAVGHALVGDPVYGRGGAGGLRLHHWRVDMPGFSASVDPGWPSITPAILAKAALFVVP